LLPLVLPEGYVEQIRASLPELPDEKKNRFINDLGLSAYDASVLVAEREKADFYEEVAKGRDGKLAANWVITNLFGALNKLGKSIDESPVSAENLGKLVGLISNDTISGRIAKDVFEIMIETGDDPEKIVEDRGLKQITDTGAIEAAIDEIVAANQDKVEQIRAGKDKMLGWFVGQVMKATQGKANPAVVNKLLKEKIMG